MIQSALIGGALRAVAFMVRQLCFLANYLMADHSLGVCPEGTALLYRARFTSNTPPEMLRRSGMPIKIKDRPFKFGTACDLYAFLVTVQ
jgi:hypothetical protein